MDSELEAIRKWLGGAPVPADYWSYLTGMADEVPVGRGGILYHKAYILERNETYEVREYCPGYLNIGDDGGGYAIVLELATGGVRIVEHGTMTPDGMREVAPSFADWQRAGFRIPGE